MDFVQSIVIPADETVFWLFEGREDEVRALAGEAGLTFERILESLTIDGTKGKGRSKSESSNHQD